LVFVIMMVNMAFLGEIKAKDVDLYLHQQGPGHVNARWPGHVPDAGGVQRVRAGARSRKPHGQGKPMRQIAGDVGVSPASVHAAIHGNAGEAR
jgi:hypothetical protein